MCCIINNYCVYKLKSSHHTLILYYVLENNRWFENNNIDNNDILNVKYNGDHSIFNNPNICLIFYFECELYILLIIYIIII